MKKDSKLNNKFNKFIKWIFKNSSIGYKNLQNDTSSVNSLSLLIDMNSNNIKVIENQFKQDSRRKRKKKCRKSIDQQMLNFQKKQRFILKNDLLDQMESKEDYLNKIWTPKSNSSKIQNEGTASNLFGFESNFEPDKNHSLASRKQTDIVDLLNSLLEIKECPICENDLNNLDSPLEIMPCKCVFHLYCISSYLIFKKICPFCFKNYTKKQIMKYNKKWKSRCWLT